MFSLASLFCSVITFRYLTLDVDIFLFLCYEGISGKYRKRQNQKGDKVKTSNRVLKR